MQVNEIKNVWFFYSDHNRLVLPEIKLQPAGYARNTGFIIELECYRQRTGYFFGDIWFTSASSGFTLGHKIYQTDDGGVTWTAIPNTSEINDFFNLFFVNSQVGFAQSASNWLQQSMEGIRGPLKHFQLLMDLLYSL